METVKVLIADKLPLVCEGFFALLNTYSQIEAVGKAHSGEEIVAKVKELTPDVVVMDMYMPGIDFADIITEIRKHDSNIKVLLISEAEDKESILRGIKAGGNGYFPKKAMASELVTAILTMHEQGYSLYPSAVKNIVEDYIRIGKNPNIDTLGNVSRREIEVLKLIAEGNRNKRIAEILCISPKTVQGHRAKLMTKLNIHNSTEIVRYAIQKHLIELRH